MKVTYHDPCHIGRHLNKFEVDTEGTQLWPGAYVGMSEEDCVYEEPRELLQAIPGVEFMEMERNRANSYLLRRRRRGDDRLRRLGRQERQPAHRGGHGHRGRAMVSTCPFCHYNLNAGSQRIQLHEAL